jgi:hypothetical protein
VRGGEGKECGDEGEEITGEGHAVRTNG